MRFVSSLPPLPAPVEAEEPVPVNAIRPARPVEPRTRVPRVIQRFESKPGAGKGSGSRAVRLEKRTVSDRREWCRRMQHGQAFLDTRDGERRKQPRREGDIATTLDEEG